MTGEPSGEEPDSLLSSLSAHLPEVGKRFSDLFTSVHALVELVVMPALAPPARSQSRLLLLVLLLPIDSELEAVPGGDSNKGCTVVAVGVLVVVMAVGTKSQF